MTAEETDKMREWVNSWKETANVLEKLRREEIRNTKISEAIPVFDDALRSALWLRPAEPTSGLVEFHRLLAKTK